MAKVRLISASFGAGSNKELVVNTPLRFEDYTIDLVRYNDDNTDSRINSMHPRLKGKIPKMMEWYDYPDYDYYIWIDSRFIILDGFFDVMFSSVQFEDATIALFNHNKRSSINSELEYMNKRMYEGSNYLIGRYNGERMSEQVDMYLKDEAFIDNNLFAGGCFIYTKKLVEDRNYNMMTDWFMHNCLFSIQDQLSLPYLLHKHNINYHVLPYDIMNNYILRYDYSDM